MKDRPKIVMESLPSIPRKPGDYFFLENSRLVIFQLKFTVLQSRRNAVKAIRGFPQVTEVKIKEVGR